MSKNIKKIQIWALIFMMISVFTAVGYSQNRKLEEAKSALQEGKIESAKKIIDEAVLHPKTSGLAETWYVKGLVYNSINYDTVLNKKYVGILDTAFAALKISYQLNKEDYKRFMLTYNSGTNVALFSYNGYYTNGVALYNQKKFIEALNEFKKADEVNEFIRLDGQSNRPVVDTYLVINLAMSAENSGDKKVAATYYGQVADLKIVNDTYAPQTYKWLCMYYYKTEPDSVLLQKYMYVGKKLYPKDDFYSKLDIDISRNKNKKGEINQDVFAKYESFLADDPNNVDVLDAYKADLFNYLYPNGSSKPLNSDAQSKRLLEIFYNLLALQPGKKVDLSLEIGKYFYAEYTFGNSDLQPLNIKKNGLEERIYELKKKLKTQKTKQNTEKLNTLNTDLAQVNKERDIVKSLRLKNIDSAIYYLEIPYNAYYQKYKEGSMKGNEKTALKITIDLIITCYTDKKDTAKATFYEDRYSEIK